MRAEEIRTWDMKAHAQFDYVDDGAVDTWRSHADEVLAGKEWQGDCDDLAHTALDLMARAGAPLTSLCRLTVYASSNAAGHMVGAALDDDGKWWIVGDTYAAEPYAGTAMLHTPKDFNRLSEAGPGFLDPVWRVGVPWKAPA